MLYLSGGLDGSAVFKEQLDDFDAVLLAGNVQGREAIESARVGIRFAIEQELGDADMSTMGRNVQGSQIVDCHLIDGRLVMKKDPRGIYMIALCSHVQRC